MKLEKSPARLTRNLFAVCLMVLTYAAAVRAQVASNSPYTLEQSVITGGGGTSSNATGNQFSITGSIGQAITDSSSNAPFTIKSGFFTAPPQFAPTAATVTIGGRAITSTGRGIRSVLIRLTSADGTIRLATTTAFGYYRFTEVNAGETCIITAKGKRFEFSQPARVLNVNEDVDDVNFIANPN